MREEEYDFYQDVREKAITGRSAHRARTHCGKGGPVRLPSDHLTKKELEQLNGECKTYRLNAPMKWAEFRELPDEHKITYIKLLRQKYNPSDRHIGTMLGISQAAVSKEFIRLGIPGGCRNGQTPWDEEGWRAWAFGEKQEESEATLAPGSGAITFDGSFAEALKTAMLLLAGGRGSIRIRWSLE